MNKFKMYEHLVDALDRMTMIAWIVMITGYITSATGAILMIIGVFAQIEMMMAIGFYSQFALFIGIAALFVGFLFEKAEEMAIRKMWENFEG